MKLTLKGFLALMVALLLAVLGGWIWGAAGRSQSDEALVQSGVRLHLAGARAAILEARVNLFEVNFGNASRSLEAARADLKTAAEAMDRSGRKGDADAARSALAKVDEAQQLAGKLDQTANARLAEAVGLLPRTP
jgi:hypothetical protein